MPTLSPLVTTEPPAPLADERLLKPGLHRHNLRRRVAQPSPSHGLRYLQIILLVLGCSGVAYYGYALSDQYIYQAYQNWAFDQQIAGRPQVTFSDYLREATPFAFLAGGKPVAPSSIPALHPNNAAVPSKSIAPPAPGALVGRVEIARLNLAAMVREGVDADTLSKAVGHVPTTSLPGEPGNFAIAAHRDTLFRALKDIQKDDLVTFQSTAGTYTYKVLATKIVKPSDVSVLRPDGGGLIPEANVAKKGQSGDSLLTMITCYPFYYVGSAPKRFIVEGKLVSSDAKSVLPVKDGSTEARDASPPPQRTKPAIKRRVTKQVTLKEPRPVRGSFHVSASNGKKKRGFWHRLFHLS